MQFQSTTNIQFSATKPSNPIEGSAYYDTSNNSMQIYINGSWITYYMYQTDKIDERKRKISSIINKLT